MKSKEKEIAVFWFRRDLRLDDNCGLYHALRSGYPVLPVFIFDRDILDFIENRSDRRAEFIYKEVNALNNNLNEYGSSVFTVYDTPMNAWKELTGTLNIKEVYMNHDYEPYAIRRDQRIKSFLENKGIAVKDFKDQVIFEDKEIVNEKGNAYKIFTPYSKKWQNTLKDEHLKPYKSEINNFLKIRNFKMPSADEMELIFTGGAYPSAIPDRNIVKNYNEIRNDLSKQTTRIGIHLRFGTVSIRKMVKLGSKLNNTWLKELIWREFFMNILFNFPHVTEGAFRPEFDNIKWINNEEDFDKWCKGLTGYPLVDAGMRELNETGFMHNRVRMVTASFLTKHLLIDWRWGESYFADKLLDYELASNNGNWQWSAGTGCDASPYFRVFNPIKQIPKFDPDHLYIKKWVPEYTSPDYPLPIIEHKLARERALEAYKQITSRFRQF